jgi:hypothetical protein
LPQDRIIAYTFANEQYLLSERLPASGNFFYLPMQESYLKNPLFGININACEQINAYKPKVMFIDKWKVWDTYSWESYASCIQNTLDSDYMQLDSNPYYIRKDLFTEEMRSSLQRNGFIK